MSLQNGIDTVSYISFGVFSLTFGSTDGGNIASLHASFGLLEDAPAGAKRRSKWLLKYFKIRR